MNLPRAPRGDQCPLWEPLGLDKWQKNALTMWSVDKDKKTLCFVGFLEQSGRPSWNWGSFFIF